MSRLIGLGGDGTATPLSVALQSARDALNASAQSQSQSQSQAQAPQLGKSQTRAGPAVIPVGPAALTTTGTGSSGSSSSSVVTWLTNVFSPVTSLLDKTELAEITDSTYTEFEHILTTVLPVNFVESANAFVNSVNQGAYADNPVPVRQFIESISEDLCIYLSEKFSANLVYDCVEKLILTKIYAKVFSPNVDLEQDKHLFDLVGQYSFIKPSHLDIHPSHISIPTWQKASEYLFQLNSMKTPLSKLIAISKCCKTIYSTLKPSRDSSVDEFLPILIYVVLMSNPPSLISNIQFILKYRRPAKMLGEAGYHLTSLRTAVSFLLNNVNATSLSIDPQRFAQYMGQSADPVPPDDNDNWVVVTERGSYVSVMSDTSLLEEAISPPIIITQPPPQPSQPQPNAATVSNNSPSNSEASTISITTTTTTTTTTVPSIPASSSSSTATTTSAPSSLSCAAASSSSASATPVEQLFALPEPPTTPPATNPNPHAHHHHVPPTGPPPHPPSTSTSTLTQGPTSTKTS